MSITKHGHAQHKATPASRTYYSWAAMIQRTTQKNHPAFADYGQRGIGVCRRWRKFENFLADMGERPSGLTLDRRNNNKGYSPSNCKWSTRAEQNRNKRNTAKLRVGRVTRTQKEWAESSNIPYHTLRARLRKGWTPLEAITTPVDERIWNGRRQAI